MPTFINAKSLSAQTRLPISEMRVCVALVYLKWGTDYAASLYSTNGYDRVPGLYVRTNFLCGFKLLDHYGDGYHNLLSIGQQVQNLGALPGNQRIGNELHSASIIPISFRGKMKGF
jgi:hypothetical protein